MRVEEHDTGRRNILRVLASGAALSLTGCLRGPAGQAEGTDREAGEGISPGEDLMREHGVIERILLVYEESARRLEGAGPGPFEVLEKAAGIIRSFVEDYHERLEEQFLFLRFEAAQREVELVHTLRAQHARGRELTDEVVRLLSAGDPSGEAGRTDLARVLRSFSRMYRPHAAREDTVLFPAFQGLVGSDVYHELGEQFEEREHAQLGDRGFFDAVREVASLEQALGIHQLAVFTAP